MSVKTTLLRHIAILCIFSFQGLMFIEADEGRIKQLCSATSSPDICTSCLESDPGSKTATDVGLIEISIVCATNKIDLLYQDTFNYQGDGSIGCTMKEALNDCLDQFVDAKAKVNQLSDLVKQKDFNGAIELINVKILGIVSSCKDSVKSKGLEVPLVVAKDLNVVDESWNDIKEIMASLKSSML